ncbi:MAG: TonB-dependent receptor [Pacificimonas sp.]
MTKSLYRSALRASSALAAAAIISAPALAQVEVEGEEATVLPAAGLERDGVPQDVIVVTGSRISNPNLDLSSPVAVVTAEELTYRQTNVAEQFLRELPSAVPSIGSAVNNGNGGSSFVNLRGVGAVRNLVLLDGRRFVPATTAGIVDLNNIPLSVVERTDVLTGGATTTYGADAVSGVVNFITRRDFEGAEVTLSEQLTEEGDGNVFRAEVTLGANFDDGRGNAVLALGYQEQDAVFQGDREFSEFNVSSFSGQPSGSSNSIPANFVFFSPVNPDTDEPFGEDVVGQFNPDSPTGLNPFNQDPFNFNPFNIFQTPFERFNMFGSARYEIDPAVELYTQGTFSRQTVSTIIAPGGSFFNTYTFNLNNPFIDERVRRAVGLGLGLSDGDDDDDDDNALTRALNSNFGETLADGSPNPDYVEFQAQNRRRTVEAGTRESDFTTTIFNFVVGARGDITDNLSYDVYGQYGESERFQRQTGFGRFDRLQQAFLAVEGEDGNIVCTDPSGGCVPINLFGPLGTISPESIDYSFGLSQSVINTATLATVAGSVTGNFGSEFSLNEDPIGFAVGVEYREYGAQRQSDEASQTPGAVVGGGGAAPDVDGSYDVFDVFGEVVIPVLSGLPFAENLTIELGARYSDYSTAGTEFTWKAGGSYTPFDGATIRGNFQKAARAPNIGELFLPVVTGLNNLANDPCQGDAPLNDANLAAVCIAQGAPSGVLGSIAPPAAGQINQTTGGNLDLGVEEAETWTVGVLLQPDFVPGLAVTVDYFNISITDAITAPTIGDIISGCFNNITAASATDPACTDFIVRNPFTGGLDGSPDSTPGLLLQLTNQGRIETDGIDLTLGYSNDLTDTLGLNLSFQGTWTNKNTFQASPQGLNRECISFFSVNCGSLQPEFAWNQRTTLTYDDNLSVSLRWRYLSSFEQEPQDIIDNGEAFIGNSPLFGDVDFTEIPSESYFDLSLQYELDPATFTFTVQNLFDNDPTVVGSDIGSTAFNSGNIYPSTFDALGRRYAAAVKFRF